MRRNKSVGVLSVTSLLIMLFGLPAQAGAQTRTDGVDLRSPSRHAEIRAAALATFEGRTIDLASDWGEARACLVWRQGGVFECFRTAEDLDTREAQLAPRRATTPTPTASTAASSYTCARSLRLYDNYWYGGRRLSFWDRGLWQNLADYGFEDQTSSYIVGACTAYLAEHSDGGGWWYPGPSYPYAGEPVMEDGWSDVISSIYIT